MDGEIRRVAPGEWAAFRDIRLAALADAPYAFAGTLETETGYDERRWREWVSKYALFLAWEGERPVGMVGGYGQEDGGWHVISMWVAPQARGSGLAGRLIGAVARHARGQNAPTTGGPASAAPAGASRSGRTSPGRGRRRCSSSYPGGRMAGWAR
jgi:GNAT superfamily N-acetyltransferase